MPFALMAIRMLLAATAFCSLAAAWPVAFGTDGLRLLEEDGNRWSGLLGLLVAGSAAIAGVGALAPRWVLAHPAAIVLAGIPLVSLLLVRFSVFDSTAMLAWALTGALFAGIATLALPALALLTRNRGRTPARSTA
ncbi:hypothetical protein [Arthrobacter sp. KK5.5]|uniref:hypothetical protein n=1 Tax=Arthrobacter sp. KK5.5 TaxID=3373084 RepID=UPI003EE60143